MTDRFMVGTASWTDPSLIKCGRFYPADCKTPEARLRYYASQFDFVEVDSSYYALPSARNSQAWADRTPEEFRFNVKAFRLFTGHQTPRAAFPKDLQAELPPPKTGRPSPNVYAKNLPAQLLDEVWKRFLGGIEPLERAGKLVALHFQFAPWFTRTAESLDYIEAIRDRLPDARVAVEFRHQSWFAGDAARDTLDFEREHGLTHVVTDEPQGFANSVPTIWEVTTPELAVVRLHGRNVATWNARDAQAASDRFNYDYPNSELHQIARDIVSQLRGAKSVQAIFNNNHEDQGQRNARTLLNALHE